MTPKEVDRPETISPDNEKLNVSRRFNLPHSPGVKAGGFIFLSGMVSINDKTGEISLGSIEDEARQIFRNMSHLLQSAGSSLDRVVKLNVFIHSIDELSKIDDVCREFFFQSPPARTVCGAPLSFDLKVEIECIALA